MALNKTDVQSAAEKLAGRIVRTPVVRHPAIDKACGKRVFLKCENLQHIGAFKARGALLNALNIEERTRSRGLVTYSSGNHGQAVAFAAKRLGISATIAIPEDAPIVKVDGMRSLGANIVVAGKTSDDRKMVAHEIVSERKSHLIEPFDHPLTIAGQGTATLEFLEQESELDALVVPVGGGGLISGACLATENTDVKVYSVEPIGCDSLRQSMAAGERVPVPPGPTIADGLRPVTIGEKNFEVTKGRVTANFTVSDHEIAEALQFLLFSTKLLVEPSGAAALAYLMAHPASLKEHENIGVILSGGNVAPDLVTSIIANE